VHRAKRLRFGVVSEERGATAVEYAIMASLVAGAIVLSVTAFGLQVNRLYEPLAAYLSK
jgi:Flp pilus assembly pilin Flp